MMVKVKCAKCGDTLRIWVTEENRRKATVTKRVIKDIVYCGTVGETCNMERDING